MQYQPIPPLSTEAIEAILQRNDSTELAKAVISVALHADQLEWGQQLCMRLASHPEPTVRGNALLGFGHLARRFADLDKQSVVPLVTAGLNDGDAYVRSQAYAAADDINHFLQFNIEP